MNKFNQSINEITAPECVKIFVDILLNMMRGLLQQNKKKNNNNLIAIFE